MGPPRFDIGMAGQYAVPGILGNCMQFLTENRVLERSLLRCVERYDKVAFAIAWASADTRVFQKLTSSRIEIRRAVIGTHFFQTHPDVLDTFVENPRVRFVLQPSGVFHPKVFVFWDEGGWEAFVGSANLTKGALTSNSEAVMLVSRADTGNDVLKTQMLATVRGYWDEGSLATETSAERYRELWKLRQPILRRLSGEYGVRQARKSPVDSATMSMPWRAYYDALRRDKEHSFTDRCKFLEKVQDVFKNSHSFHVLEQDMRRMIAGLSSERDEHWAWFGSMMGAGKFQTAVNSNNIHLSHALDEIPLDGTVSRAHYNAYIEEFVKAFPDGRDGIATATRLLAMKRPDEFVCFDSMNRKHLCADFGIKASGMDYERYWVEVVEPIRDSPWWNSPQPRRGAELSAWKGRAAMLDALFYVHE